MAQMTQLISHLNCDICEISESVDNNYNYGKDYQIRFWGKKGN